jgi:hypothetical protein
VFEWKRSSVWRKHIVALAHDILNPAVLDAVKKAGTDRIVSDDSLWLDRAIRTGGKVLFEDAFLVLAKRLSTYYTHIRVYHACRTTDTRFYYLRGLQVLRREELRQMAVRIFVTPRFPEISEGMIEKAIADAWLDKRDERVFVGLDDRYLIRYCGHYLIQGSERLMGLAVRLKPMTGKDYIHVLRNLGTPTMFVCELPFSLITEHEARQLSGIIVERLFEEMLLGKRLDRQLSFTIKSRNDIPPACIKRHYHPDGIPDPHNHGTVYYWKGK